MGSSTTLTTLKAKQARLNRRIQAAEAVAAVRERKRQTRRKILVGAYYLDQLKKANRWDELVQQMDAYLTRDTDRQLFDLAPRPKDVAPAETTEGEAVEGR